MPPTKQGDYAYLLHILRSMKGAGKAACILPHGVLFRGNAEAVIREQLVRSGILKGITPEQARLTYANEADVLNVALFGQTARQWREAHPVQEGNMRDEADVIQLLVRANLESLNAEFIHMGLPQAERLQKLNQKAHLGTQSLGLGLGKGASHEA